MHGLAFTGPISKHDCEPAAGTTAGGPVAYMREPQTNALPSMNWLDELDGARGITEGHINAGAVVVVSEELRKRETGIVTGIAILRQELPGTGLSGCIWAGSGARCNWPTEYARSSVCEPGCPSRR